MSAEGELRVRQASATELSAAQAHLSLSYCDHRLEPCADWHALDFRHSSLPLDGSGFNLLQYGEEVAVSSRGFEDFYMLEMPLAGGVDIAFGTETLCSAPGMALLLSPGPRFHSRWRAGTQQWMLQIDRGVIEARLSAISRRARPGLPVFNPVIDLSTDHGRYLHAAFSNLAALLADPEAMPAGDVDAIVPAIVDELLRNIAYLNGASVVPERLYATPRHVKQAIDLFKARFAERLLMPAVAREIGISERALYEGFQRYYQRAPYDILTRIRMETARRLMQDQGLSAAQAAPRVGIRHLGRFSATYRAVFGVLPSSDGLKPH